MTIPLMEARALTVEYGHAGNRVSVLKDLDLSIDEGRLIVIQGDNGVGKTTLVSCLAGIQTPSGGEIHWIGRDVTKMARGERARLACGLVGLVFQEPHLIHGCSILQNAALPGLVDGLSYRDAFELARSSIERTGLKGHEERRPSELSTGQKMKASLARALARARVVLADEPTASLDSDSRKAILELLLEVPRRHGGAVVLASHDREALEFADAHGAEQWVLRGGRLSRIK